MLIREALRPTAGLRLSRTEGVRKVPGPVFLKLWVAIIFQVLKSI